ncbi:ABC transporter permease [Aneurinibacillus sp. REN35]|uniref:ABC transporter permease n=1 Tax=Aneurinibacillus sp. REN35 TaxID=3237286 RepID=UPI00352905B6
MFLAIRELLYAKLRFVLVGAIIALVAWLVFIISGLASGLSFDNAGSLQTMNADYFVVEKGVDNRIDRSAIPVVDGKKIAERPYIEQAAPLTIRMSAVSNADESKKWDMAVFATDKNSFMAPEEMGQADGVYVDESVQEEGARVGDTIKDTLTGTELKIAGFVAGQKFTHTPVMYVSMEQAKELNPLRKDTAEYVNVIALKMDKQHVETFKNEWTGYEVLTKDEVLQGIPSYTAEQGSLQMMIGFLFVIAAFVLAAFFYVMTLQKTSQFGVLKALGAKTGFLARTIIGQVVLVSAISIAVGVGCTYATAAVLPEGMPFLLDTAVVVVYSLILLAVATLGSLLSLYRVTKIDAIQAIGRVE